MKNKFLFEGYHDILLRSNKKGLVFFCELNSFNSSALRLLKKDLKKKGFLLKNVKTRLARICFSNGFVRELIQGPVFLMYKESFDNETDIKALKKFYNYDFILGCMFRNKVYSFKKLQEFKKLNSMEEYRYSIIHTINSLLFYKLSLLKKIDSTK